MSVTWTFRVIPSEGTKVEYLKVPLLDKDTGFPSTETSATSILSRAIPVMVPRFPFVLLEMIFNNGTRVSILNIFRISS